MPATPPISTLRLALALALAAGLAFAACGDDGGDASTDDTTAAEDVADTSVADDTAAAEDTYVPPLEPISRVEFEIGGVSNRFDINGRADYVSAESLLKISANKGTRKIELNVVPVDPFTVGNWADTIFSETAIVVCYNDGSGSFGELSSCGVGFTHESLAYDVTITANNGADSYVEGTFSATVESATGDLLEMTNGVFEVKHR